MYDCCILDEMKSNKDLFAKKYLVLILLYLIVASWHEDSM